MSRLTAPGKTSTPPESSSWNRPRNAAPPQPSPRRTAPPYAAWLVFVTLLVVAIGGTITTALLFPSHGQSPSHAGQPAASGTAHLAARSAGGDFRPSGGEPPPDVLSALVVPIGSTSTRFINYDNSAGTYDRSAQYSSPYSYDEILGFYRQQLRAQRWSIKSDGFNRNRSGREILATRPSNDGFYWELGVIVHGPASVPSSSASATPARFDLRLIELTEN